MATHLIENEAASTPVEVRIPCGTVTLEGGAGDPAGSKRHRGLRARQRKQPA
jgi:hypothetical protein